ncbi:uncharacterized protein LOC116641143 [Phoca vitulina]|uniref:uncharacterized protein LOC116641143 n=1 Tax=Phoca vitulina TaxID=9720 RepID=UPI001395EA0B|nr:uncharacterized protein LOC116641143 [Phoca vitulina]
MLLRGTRLNQAKQEERKRKRSELRDRPADQSVWRACGHGPDPGAAVSARSGDPRKPRAQDGQAGFTGGARRWGAERGRRGAGELRKVVLQGRGRNTVTLAGLGVWLHVKGSGSSRTVLGRRLHTGSPGGTGCPEFYRKPPALPDVFLSMNNRESTIINVLFSLLSRRFGEHECKIKTVLFQLQQIALTCLLNRSGDPGSISFVLYFTFKKQHVKFPFQTTCKSYPVGAGKWRARPPSPSQGQPGGTDGVGGQQAPAPRPCEQGCGPGCGPGTDTSPCPRAAPYSEGGKQGTASSASQRHPGERKAGGPGAEGPRGGPGRATQVPWGKA